MAVALAAGAVVWLGVDPVREVFPRRRAQSIAAAV